MDIFNIRMLPAVVLLNRPWGMESHSRTSINFDAMTRPRPSRIMREMTYHTLPVFNIFYRFNLHFSVYAKNNRSRKQNFYLRAMLF